MRIFNVGEVIYNTYEVLELVNTGGMGNIYKVRHLKIPKIFALKQLKLEGYKNLFIESFISEISILNSLRHPNISRFYDSFYFNQNFFYVMEFIEGSDIKTYFSNGFDEEKLIKYFIMSLNAIDYLHSKSIIHRDIKPSNIMIDKNLNIVKIIDFGISNFLKRNMVFVSPGYSPPEQYQSTSPHPTNDIFSLGVTFLEIISGVKPYNQKNHFDPSFHRDYVNYSINQAKSKISNTMIDVITKCVEIDQSKRFQNISDIISYLNQWNIKIDNSYLVNFYTNLAKSQKIFDEIEEKIKINITKNFLNYEIQKNMDIMIIKIFDMNEITIYFILEDSKLSVYYISTFSRQIIEQIDMESLDIDKLLSRVLEVGGIV